MILLTAFYCRLNKNVAGVIVEGELIRCGEFIVRIHVESVWGNISQFIFHRIK